MKRKLDEIICFIEEILNKTKNIFSYFAIFTGLFGLFLALLTYNESIKKPEFSVNIVNDHGNYSDTMGGPLFVERYENDEIHYVLSIPTTWRLGITNLGEKTAKDVSITILFDNISFENDFIYSFEAINHQRGVGGFQGLIFNQKVNILPNESVVIPDFPFYGQAHINYGNIEYYSYNTPNKQECLDSLKIPIDEFQVLVHKYIENIYANHTKLINKEMNSCKMNVFIYSDDVVCYEKSFDIEIRDPEPINTPNFKLNIIPENNMIFTSPFKKEDFVQILKHAHDDNYISKLDFNSISSEDIKFAYYYCIQRVNSAHSNDMRKLTLIFGREYYKRLNISDSAIEQRIINDIWAEQDPNIM